MASNKDVLDMLTAITRRLDSIEVAVGLPSGGDGGGDGEEDAPYVKAYDEFASESVAPFVEQCKAVGAGGEQLVRRAAARGAGLLQHPRIARSAARQRPCTAALGVGSYNLRVCAVFARLLCPAGGQGGDGVRLPPSLPGHGLQVQEAGREGPPRALLGSQRCICGQVRGRACVPDAVGARRPRLRSCREP